MPTRVKEIALAGAALVLVFAARLVQEGVGERWARSFTLSLGGGFVHWLLLLALGVVLGLAPQTVAGAGRGAMRFRAARFGLWVAPAVVAWLLFPQEGWGLGLIAGLARGGGLLHVASWVAGRSLFPIWVGIAAGKSVEVEL